MSDEQRRERRQFEPPPWERDAFEALAAKRAQQEEEARVAAALLRGAAALDDLAGSALAPVASTVEDMGLVAAAALRAKAAEDEPAADRTDEPAANGEAARPAADEKLLQVMMLELAQQERNDSTNTQAIGWVASGITGVFGLAMVVVGLMLAAQAHGKTSAVMGSAVLTIFGLIFAGMAAWVWISSSRVRGR